MADQSPGRLAVAGGGVGLLNISPPRARGHTSEDSDRTAVLRLIAFCGERPVLALGPASLGSVKVGRLTLLNDTSLDRVIVLEKLPSGVQLIDEAGVELVADASVEVPARSQHHLQLAWAPTAIGSLCEPVRWRMADGQRQVRLECRVQGTAAAVAPARGSRPTPASKPVAAPVAGRAGPSASSVAGVSGASRAGAVRTNVGAVQSTGSVVVASGSGSGRLGAGPAPGVAKAPAKTLALARPKLPAAAPAPAPASTARHPSNTSVAVLPASRASGALDPSEVAGSSSCAGAARTPPPPAKAPGQQAGASPQLGGQQRGGGPTTPVAFTLRGASPPAKAGGRLDGAIALDFRRVMGVEGKRERDLITWMNSEVAPLANGVSAASGSGRMEGAAVRRLLGEVSGRAYLYFKRNEDFAALASKVEAKIAIKQLALKDAENTLSDVRMRQQAIEALSCYHPFWLAVGMQTVLGRALVLSPGHMMALMRPGGELPSFLRTHLCDHLLADQDMAAAYRASAHKHEYWDALGARVLGRLLLLVLLLDRLAERGGLPATAPALFKQDARMKSSEQVLMDLLQPRLAGAGDVRHALRMMSYNLSYVQHVRDEADYRVAKPADLRDGTRLAKLLDCLKQRNGGARTSSAGGAPPPLSAQPSTASLASTTAAPGVGPTCASRIPSANEDLLPTMAFPQHTGKPLDDAAMRNNCLRLARAMQQQGISLQGLAHGSAAGARDGGSDGVAKAVAEGLVRVDQRVTLGMLWHMAMHYKLRHHVDVRSLERETSRLRRTAAAAATSGTGASSATAQQPQAEEDALLLRYFNDPAAQALLQWARAACAAHGVVMDNFTWSLADGRALCYLVHTYLPEALPLSRIYTPTTPSTADEMAAMTGGAEWVKLETLKRSGWSAVYEMGGAILDEPLAAAHKKGVAANFAALHAASAALGVPPMLSPEDYLEDGPDELSALLYVALLAGALLRLTTEQRAAQTILEFLRRRLQWKPARMHACLERYKAVEQRERAATAIQSFWRMAGERRRYLALQHTTRYLQALARRTLLVGGLRRRQHAATVIQTAWRACAARRQLQRAVRAATVLQAAWRGRAARTELARQHAAATAIQCCVRGHLQRKTYSKHHRAARKDAAAVAIQAAWRGHVQRRAFQAQRATVVALQALVRMKAARVRFLEMQKAAVTIQAAVRCHQARMHYASLLRALVCIQSAWRRVQAQRQLAAARSAAVVLQAAVRGHLARRRLQEERSAAVRIQAAWRALQARRLAADLREQKLHAERHQAACVLQAVVRGRRVRQEVARMQAAAVAVQAWWRMVAARRQLLAVRSAAVTIQAAVRCHRARRALQLQRSAAVTIQSAWRRTLAVRDLHAARGAAVTLQSAWRAHRASRQYQRLRAAAVALQAAARMRAARTAYLQLRSAAVVLQAAWRARCVREELAQQHQAAACIQAMWRAAHARAAFLAAKAAAVALQAAWRAHTARAAYQRVRSAALAVQGAWRCRVARGELARRADAYYSALQQQQVELLMEVGRQYMRKVAAAIRIQAYWRGHVARRAFAPEWAEHVATRRERNAAVAIQTAWRAHTCRKAYQQQRAALSTITRVLLPLHRARRQLRQLREAHRRRLQAAVLIQRCVRLWLERKRQLETSRAATRIQAAWRGYAVRKRGGAAQLEARKRLQRAAAAAQAAPHKRLGHRAREALELVLRANKPLVQVQAAVECLETATRYSRHCCELIALGGGVAALLRFVRSCNRSKPHVDLLHKALGVLHNICRYRHLVPHVLHAEECLTVLSERLQFFRDTEEVFHPTVALLQRLVQRDELAAEVAAAPNVLRHWDGILQLLARKADLERKYLDRLEGQKGSDVSARESTRKLLTVQQQVGALEALTTRVTAAAAAAGLLAAGPAALGPPAGEAAAAAGPLGPAAAGAPSSRGSSAGGAGSDTAAGLVRDQDQQPQAHGKKLPAAGGAAGGPPATAVVLLPPAVPAAVMGVPPVPVPLAVTAGAIAVPAFRNTIVRDVVKQRIASGAAVLPASGAAGAGGKGRVGLGSAAGGSGSSPGHGAGGRTLPRRA